MTKLTVRNLTNSPFDIEGGHRLPAMGGITADFSDHYAALLRVSPGVEVVEGLEVPSPPPAAQVQPKKRARKG